MPVVEHGSKVCVVWVIIRDGAGGLRAFVGRVL
jgi:hypothetical protein